MQLFHIWHLLNCTKQTQTRQTSNQVSAYAIFLILERQRNLKLRELYRNNPVADTLLPVISEEDSSIQSSSMATLFDCSLIIIVI